MFAQRKMVPNPAVVTRGQPLENGDPSFETKTLTGAYYQVIPRTAKEVNFLQDLVLGENKFVPDKGDGVIIPAEIVVGLCL